MSHFFALLSRMKYIQRWSLMRNTYSENISEHSLEVAMIAHGLATIANVRLGKDVDADKAAVIAIFHDCPEIITGDMPTPIKYYNQELNNSFKSVEDVAANELLSQLPDDLKAAYEPLFFKQEDDEYLFKLVKGADRLSALIKCIEEGKAGNKDFDGAKQGILNRLSEMKLEEVDIFMKEFLPSFELTLDEIRKN